MKRYPDFSQFLKVLKREGKPTYLPFYEHYASSGFIAQHTETQFDKMSMSDTGYWNIYVDFWLSLGFDCIPMEIPLNCSLSNVDTHGKSYSSEAYTIIKNRNDFENYPWPDIADPINFKHFETVAKLIPSNIKIVGGVACGPYEWVSAMLGVMGLSYAIVDDPELVKDMFCKIGLLIQSAIRQLASMDAIGALRQGDDLGFKTSTFFSPEQLHKYIFPIYKNMAEESHKQGKPFILHSCGNLQEVYDILIEYCKIDAKHSFEDMIMPVEQFKQKYGNKITPLGGLDVDVICRSNEKEIRHYTRNIIEKCFYDGYWALGTGNSLTDYMPIENYLLVIDGGTKTL